MGKLGALAHPCQSGTGLEILRATGKLSKMEYINERCRKVDGKTVNQAVGTRVPNNQVSQ